MRVAVLGTGIMGGPMARNLAAAGHDVTAWNRTREKAEGLGATRLVGYVGEEHVRVEVDPWRTSWHS